MMKNRKFLLPLAVLTASLATGEQAVASDVNINPAPSDLDNLPNANDQQGRISDIQPGQSQRVMLKEGQNQFGFVLKRDVSGVMMADHESHYSHYSHESHSSHSSHYSGS